jgi:hypothetical protein
MLLRAGTNYDIKYRMGRESKEKEIILKSNGYKQYSKTPR